MLPRRSPPLLPPPPFSYEAPSWSTLWPWAGAGGKNPLCAKLLPEDDCDLEMDDLSQDPNPNPNLSGSGSGSPNRGFGSILGSPRPHAPPARPPLSHLGGALSALYWQQWLLQRRVRRNLLASEFWTSATPGQRLLIVLEAPAVWLRDVSIPTLQPECWSKVYACLHPLAAPQVRRMYTSYT